MNYKIIYEKHKDHTIVKISGTIYRINILAIQNIIRINPSYSNTTRVLLDLQEVTFISSSDEEFHLLSQIINDLPTATFTTTHETIVLTSTKAVKLELQDYITEYMDDTTHFHFFENESDALKALS